MLQPNSIFTLYFGILLHFIISGNIQEDLKQIYVVYNDQIVVYPASTKNQSFVVLLLNNSQIFFNMISKCC